MRILLFTGGGKNLLEVYMNMAHLLHFGSRALRNFDDDKQGSGAKVRIQILKQLIMDKAKTQRLNQMNKKAREKHLNGNKPMMLVPGKGGKLYYCWTKKDCDFTGLKKQLIKQELKMLMEAELKINKSASHVDKQKIKKVHNNWGYALKIASEWFYKNCVGEAPAPDILLKDKENDVIGTDAATQKEKFKVENTLNFVVNCLLPSEENKEATRKLANQIEKGLILCLYKVYLLLFIYLTCDDDINRILCIMYR
jgi:hypothetical protein